MGVASLDTQGEGHVPEVMECHLVADRAA